MLRDVQGPLAPTLHQFRTANLPVGIDQLLMLVDTKEQAAGDASLHSTERDAIERLDTVGAGIVANAGLRAEGRTRRPLFLSFSRERPHGLHARCFSKLRAQTKAASCLGVHPLVRHGVVGDVLMPAHKSNPTRRRVKSSGCLGKDRLMPTRIEGHTHRSFDGIAHKYSIVGERQGPR